MTGFAGTGMVYLSKLSTKYKELINDMIQANWIRTETPIDEVCPLFKKEFRITKKIKSATLCASARGVYEASVNGKRVGEYVLAPGWTVYERHIQMQEYDVTGLLAEDNTIVLMLAKGWYLGRITRKSDWNNTGFDYPYARECAVIAELHVLYEDGTRETVITDESWETAESNIRFCDFYDGEIYDATFEPVFNGKAVIADNNDRSVLVPQIGEEITEQERIKPVALIRTPEGDTVIDFGQNLTGYLEFTVNAAKGDEVDFSFAEILDKNGNFYNKNYRSAKAIYHYICKEGQQTFKPLLTFYGFRYVRVNKFPQEKIDLDQFTAIVVHSNMRRTGVIETSDPMLNQLFSNIIWGQKGNYLDVPTDCPQRDERLGWTGDAQVFVRTASYNYDVRKFFLKWLTDMKFSQEVSGAVPPIIPKACEVGCGAAWSDAALICPWQMYLTYADKEILRIMFPVMTKWVDYMTNTTTTPYLWTGHFQYGDWLELAAPYGECKGETRDDLIGSAFYAYSSLLASKVGYLIGENETAAKYEELHHKVAAKFKATYEGTFKTQTEHVLALHFDLTDHRDAVLKSLVDLIHRDGDKIQTGFVGTPYILHVLSDNGYAELAYDLLLRKEFPSWLYPITKGATTMWEHWDGIMPNGDIWPDSMNSYNHYAYGAVADWMYGVCAGINTVEAHPGFAEIEFRPIATDKIDHFSASIDTAYGKISSRWWHEENGTVRYEIITPRPAKAVIGGEVYKLEPGCYRF